MGISLVAWSQSVAGLAVQVDLTAVPDDHVRTEGNNIVVPKYNKIVGAYAIGVDIQNVQLSSPSMRTFALYDVGPVENVALPLFPPDFIQRTNNPIDLVEDEQLLARAGNSNAAAQQESMLLAISDGQTAPALGSSVTVRHTATAPATPYAWANTQMAATQVLPAGSYKIIGARCEQAATIAFRINFVGGIWRPGTLAVGDQSAKDVKGSRNGEMGVWGMFEHLTPPSVDFFGSGAGGAAVIYLDLTKV